MEPPTERKGMSICGADLYLLKSGQRTWDNEAFVKSQAFTDAGTDFFLSAAEAARTEGVFPIRAVQDVPRALPPKIDDVAELYLCRRW